MWPQWKEHFAKFGAKRIDFSTSRKGGSRAGSSVTGAKCLLFFDGNEADNKENLEYRIGLDYIATKTLCLERMEVRMLEEQNFGYQVRDSDTGDYYGTKEGYPIFEFTPFNLAESKGTEKHRAGRILARAFKLKKHRQWGENKRRETTYSFSGTESHVITIQLKGSY